MKRTTRLLSIFSRNVKGKTTPHKPQTQTVPPTPLQLKSELKQLHRQILLNQFKKKTESGATHNHDEDRLPSKAYDR